MTDKRVGFVGLGNMGGAIAQRLMDMGQKLVVCDLDQELVKQFASGGAAIASSPREVANGAEVVLTCLPSLAASLDVALGKEGIVHGTAVKVLIETSTIGRAHAERLDAELPPEIGFIDAPVSGGPPGALAGTLTTMCSGAREHFDFAHPVLSTMAKHVFYVGPKAGMAQTAKLINNHLSTAGRLAAFEGLVVAMKAGLDIPALVELINVSSGRNYTTTDKIPAAILSGTFKFNGLLTNSLKDEQLLLNEAQELGVPLWLAPRLLQTLTEAAEAGYRHQDSMMVIQFMGELSGIDVRELMRESAKRAAGA